MARPIPKLDDENRQFWTGGGDGVLRIVLCGDCGGHTHPPRGVCRHCLSENVAYAAVSGEGTVDTYTVNYQRWMPDQEVPYVIARVALADAPGVFLTTNIVGCDPETVAIGDRVRVRFEQCGEIYLPLFAKES